MSALTLIDTAATTDPPAQRSRADALRVAALSLLSIRFIQGFIYWGGGSRRFIYAPSKLDPNAASWTANKFQSAMPGALLGTDDIIAFLLRARKCVAAAQMMSESDGVQPHAGITSRRSLFLARPRELCEVRPGLAAIGRPQPYDVTAIKSRCIGWHLI